MDGNRRTRVRSGLHKLRWGIGTVGVAATARGLARYSAMVLRRPPTIEVRLRSGGSLMADVPGQVVPALVIFGDVIDPEYPFLRRIVRPDSVVVDVGAAIGQFTVFAARLGVRVVHACEPSDPNLASLLRNVERNGVTGTVAVHRLALSNVVDELAFTTAPTTYLSRLDSAGPARLRDDESELVPVRPLDAATKEWGLSHIDILKVNVAGDEPVVLAGADALFAAGRVDIVIALVGARSLASYVRMATLGYRFFFFHPRQGVLHEIGTVDHRLLSWRPAPARHVIAIRSEAIEAGLLGGMPIVPVNYPIGQSEAPPGGVVVEPPTLA